MRLRSAVVPIGSFVQDIDVISLAPHGRSGGGIQVSIGGKTANNLDDLGTPAIGLHQNAEPGRSMGASAPNPRQPSHHREETPSISSFGRFAIHSVVPILPVAHGQRQLITNALTIRLPAGSLVIS